MSMSKELEQVHEQLVGIAQDSQRLSRKGYDSYEVLKLQRRLSDADASYYNGKLDKDYESQGQAQVSDEFHKVHHILHSMLERVDSKEQNQASGH
ncbi:unnamed protein product [Absidia cylindrospora]